MALAALCLPASAGAYVYWTNSSSNSIGRANLDGSGVNESFITGAFNPAGVAVNGAYVYWANEFTDTRIGRASLNGSSPDQSFITGASGPVGLAVDSLGPSNQTPGPGERRSDRYCGSGLGTAGGDGVWPVA